MTDASDILVCILVNSYARVLPILATYLAWEGNQDYTEMTIYSQHKRFCPIRWDLVHPNSYIQLILERVIIPV